MPKMRGIKPETWTDDKMVEVSPLARLLFIGMWNYACDNGHVENKPRQLKMRILPADDCEVIELLGELAAVGCVNLEDGWIHIPALPLHQRIDKRYFTSCDHCAPDEIPEGHAVRTSGARSAPGVRTGGARVEGRKEGSEGEGSEGERKGDASAPAARKRASQLPDTFRPSDKHVALAASLGVDLRREWDKFGDHHRAKGSTFKDWSAALNNWIRKAAEYGGKVTPIRATDEQGREILPPLPKGVFEQ